MQVLYLAIASLVVVVLAIVLLLLRSKVQVTPEQSQATEVAVRRRGAAARGARRRRQEHVAEDEAEVVEGDVRSQHASRAQGAGTSRQARLNARKQKKKEAKRRAREEREASDSDSGEASDAAGNADLGLSAYELARRQKEADREQQEQAQEDLIRQAQQEREQREQSEFDAWKGSFQVEGAGEDTVSAEEQEKLKREMCSVLEERKMVQLEELSAEFSMRTRDVVALIQTMEESGQLTGIMDDRGKYIHLSDGEMRTVADHVIASGRVAISDLAKEASALMKLDYNRFAGSDRAAGAATASLDDLVDD